MNDIPKTPFALISGTATWGAKFPEDMGEPGIRVVERDLSFETPWGVQDRWQLLEFDGSVTIDGKTRLVLNVFAHGWSLEEVDHGAHRRVFWVLGQAGARKVMADNTTGSLNRAIQPRDYVIVNDCLYLSQTEYSVSPGRFKYANRGMQMFCPSMGKTLKAQADELWPDDARVYGQENNLVLAHTWGPRFETPAETRALQLLGGDVCGQSASPEATNAREIGACYIAGSYIVNYVDGVLPHEWGELDKIHTEMKMISGKISLRTMAKIELTDECGCHEYHKSRPSKYKPE
jgi:5'-methylthioadenosine phosphorylase